MSFDTDRPKMRRGVLLTTNMLFSSMVTGTALALGHDVVVAGDVVEAVDLCRASAATYVIVDLGIAEIDIESAVARLRETAGAVPILAFGSHVDKARLDAARAAGCDEVLPRSKFSAELPALLRRYFDGVQPS